MTEQAQTAQDVENDRLSDLYREAVGSVMAARKIYDDVCVSDGSESVAAAEAHGTLEAAVEHRNELRARYDLVIDRRLKR